MASCMRICLVCSALNMAIVAGQPAPGVIVHTDIDSQLANDDYCELLAKHQLTESMSGKGNCYDNALIKRFF